MVIQAHLFKEKTPKHGEKWAEIADNLNKAEQFNNKLTMRLVREKTNTLIKNFRTTQRAELAATGINPDQSEVEVLLEEICLQIEEFDRQISENNNKVKDAERDKVQGEEIRLKAMESQCQTAKRRAEMSPDDEKKKSQEDSFNR